MKINSKILAPIFFILPLACSIFFGIYSYKEPSFANYIWLTFSLIWFIEQAFILALNFQKKIKITLSIFSLVLSSSFLFNLNEDWFLDTWKFQVVTFICSFLIIWNFRFINVLKVWLTISLITQVLLFALFLGYLIWKNEENESFFHYAKIILTYLFFSQLIVSYFGFRKEKEISNNS